MNTPDLLKKVQKTLEETGLLDEIAEHVRSNPQLFSKTESGKLITNFNICLSFIVEQLKDISSVKPDLYLFCGTISTAEYDRYVYSHMPRARTSTWINNACITEVYDAE